MSDAKPQTPQPADIFALVHADLDERNQKGLETYGRTLTAFDGRDTHRDLYEELLDAVMYERKRQVEREAALKALDYVVSALSLDDRWIREQVQIIEEALGRKR